MFDRGQSAEVEQINDLEVFIVSEQEVASKIITIVAVIIRMCVSKGN
jgi:hypothetical protein